MDGREGDGKVRGGVSLLLQPFLRAQSQWDVLMGSSLRKSWAVEV